MQLRATMAAVLALVGVPAAQAITVTVYDSASFVPIGGGDVELLGFGRGSSNIQAELLAGSEIFFDTWNIQVDLVAPGTYGFSGLTIDAAGGLTFDSVALSSYDAGGVRHTVVFDISPDGSQAVGSGNFQVLASCPVASCVWIDLIGMQPAGGTAGYGGSGVASPVPEPATVALWLAGLAVVGAGAARRRHP